MNIDDVQKIGNELKDFHLIESKRKIIPKEKYHCNFATKPGYNSIFFDPGALIYLTNSEVSFFLLHEEGHLVLPQKKEMRKVKFVIIWLVSMIISSIIFLVCFGVPPFFLLLVYFIISIALFYVDKRYFYKPYWEDELDADEYAVKGLFLIRSDIVSWQEMYSSFKHLDECKKKNKRKGLSIYRLKGLTYSKLKIKTHPSDKIRIKNARNLFNKYNNRGRSIN